MQLILPDSSGALWQITVNPDGSLSSAPAPAGTVPSNPNSNCTILLQDVVNFCMTHGELMPIANVGGFTSEPALSLANDTLQELLAQPFNWKFNSNDMGILVTQMWRQDNLFAGASAFTSTGGVGIDLATNNAVTETGSTVNVNTLQPHNFTVGQTVYMTGNTDSRYNSVFTQTPTSSVWSGGWTITATPTPTSFQFTHSLTGLPASGAAGIYDYGWLEACTMTNAQDTSPVPYVHDLETVRTLQRSSTPGTPKKIAVMSDTGSGVLTIRLSGVPAATVWAVALVYQSKAPLKTSLNNTWAPFPDEFAFVYRQAFLARCYRYLDSPRADAEMQKAEAMIMKGLGRDDSEDSDQYVAPAQSLMGYDTWG